MEHHIYLTFLSTLNTNYAYSPEALKKTVVNLTEISPFNVILQTNESALKYLLHHKRVNDPNFTIEKFFLFKTEEMLTTFKDSNISTLNVFNNQMRQYINHEQIPISWTTDTINYIDCDDIDYIDNLKDSIINMSNAIMSYFNAQPEGDTVTLHVDLSGGPRTAIMLMTAIIRLVAFQGIHIGSILYANINVKKQKEVRVYEGNSIYNIYDMITGFAEFNQFGSVDTLQTYVNTLENPDKQITNLISKMNEFSDAIRLSSRGQFQKSMEDIDNTLKDIETGKQNIVNEISTGHKNFEIETLKLMSNKIQANYATVLSNKEDDLAYIDWCLDNGYLQQALALFTEFIPRVILKSNMISLDETIFPKEKNKKTIRLSDTFGLINEKIGTIMDVIDDTKNNIYNAIKEALIKHIKSIKNEQSNIIRQLKQNPSSTLEKEKASLITLETEFLNTVNDIIIEQVSKNIESDFTSHIQHTVYKNDGSNLPSKFLKFLSAICIDSMKILELNDFDDYVREVIWSTQKLSDNHNKSSDIYTVDKNNTMSLVGDKKPVKLKADIFNMLKSDEVNNLIPILFRKIVTYHYNMDNFPNAPYNIEGLTLNPILKNNEHLTSRVCSILNQYRQLKKSRNETAHANEVRTARYITPDKITNQIRPCIQHIREVSDYIKKNSTLD